MHEYTFFIRVYTDVYVLTQVFNRNLQYMCYGRVQSNCLGRYCRKSFFTMPMMSVYYDKIKQLRSRHFYEKRWPTSLFVHGRFANGTQRVARIDQMKWRRVLPPPQGVIFFTCSFYEGKVFERRRIHVNTIKRKTLSFARGVPEHCVNNFFVLSPLKTKTKHTYLQAQEDFGFHWIFHL